MNKKFLTYYNQELSFLREEGNIFAKKYPKIAARLGMDSTDIPDPYVERILEGIAFLNARTHLKIDASYPEFVSHILEVIYPQFLMPQPAATIVELELLYRENFGVINHVKRGDTFRSFALENNGKIHCNFSCAQDLELAPIKLEKATYSSGISLSWKNLKKNTSSYSTLKLDFSVNGGGLISDLLPENLKIFLGNDLNISSQLLYLLTHCCEGVICHSYDNMEKWQYSLKDLPQQLGFSEEETLSFGLDKKQHAFSIIQDYIHLPEKFLFIKQTGLKQALQFAEKNNQVAIEAHQIKEVITENGVNKKVIGYQKRWFSLSFIFNRNNLDLQQIFKESYLSIHAIPIVNVFKKKGVRFSIDNYKNDYHIVIDKMQPLNYEVYYVENARGFDKNNQEKIVYYPVYHPYFQYGDHNETGFFSIKRKKRMYSKNNQRTYYIGHESFISMSNYNDNIHQLAIDLWCTNRDIPILMPSGLESDFLLDGSLPLKSIKMIKKMVRPKEAIDDTDNIWPLLDLLRLNYSNLLNISEHEAANILKEMLKAFPYSSNDLFLQNVEAIVALKIITTRRIVREKLHSGIVRGLEIRVVIDEGLMGGVHPCLFGSILRHYFTFMVSVNSFVDFHIETLHQKDIISWSSELGSKGIL